MQSSILKDHETETYYKVPSKLNPIARKIYQAFGVHRDQRIRKMDAVVPKKALAKGELA